jgi:hypothetical protein
LTEFTGVLIIHNTARINRLRIILFQSFTGYGSVQRGPKINQGFNYQTRYTERKGLHHSGETTTNIDTLNGIHVPAFNKQFAK